jgi:polyferredoxin
MPESSPPARNTRRFPYIRLVQGFFFVLVALIAANHALVERGIAIPFLSSASLHALCPFGGVASLYQYIVSGTFVRRIQASSFVIMWLVFLLALPFGTLFCGWICPLGTFQEAVARLGKKCLGNRYNRLIPRPLDSTLRFLRYGVLAWVVVMTIHTTQLVFADYCPYDALFTSWTGNAAAGGLAVVGVILLLSLAVERPFCKYACPYGALLGLTNRFRLVKLKRNAETCIKCGRCDQVCPMNLSISDRETINQTQCITCLQCTSQAVCPVEQTLELRLPRLLSRQKSAAAMTPLILAAVITLVFAGGIFSAQALGYWKTTGGREPVRISTGAFEGVYDPADIRGAYTLAETSRYFDIPLETLAAAFEVPVELAAHVRHGDLEDYYHELEMLGTEIGNGSAKLFVALYTGLPYEVDEPTYLLSPAVNLLEAQGTLTPEQLEYVRTHRIDPDSYSPPDWGHLATELKTGDTAIEITGNTTYRDLLEAGLDREAIEAVIGTTMPDPGTTIQSDAAARGASFGKLRTEFQEVLDQFPSTFEE